MSRHRWSQPHTTCPNVTAAPGPTQGKPRHNNLVQSDGTYHYLYDDEGNRIAKFVDLDNDNQWDTNEAGSQYTWDHRNRLTKAEWKVGPSGSATKSVDYVYDPFNQLIKRTVDGDGAGNNPSAIDQTFYLYDQGQAVLQFEKTGSGSVAAADLAHRYLWNPAAVDQLFADEQVTSLSNAGQTYWMLSDNLGSIRDVVDSNGNLRIHRDFDSFGNIIAEDHNDASGVAVTIGQPGYVEESFGFTGRFLDQATGLQNNLHRWYDASTGRWLSEDPIGFGAGDANLTRYVGNMPTMYIDPSGMAGGLVGGGGNDEDWRERREKLEQVGFWDGVYDGVYVGILTIGKAGWAPIRGLGITNLLGLEDNLQSADDLLDRKQGDLAHEEDAVGQGLVKGGQVGAGVGVAATGGAAALRAAPAVIRAFRGLGTPRIDPNKLNHIFNNAGHNLGSLVNHFGSREAAFRAVQSAVQRQHLSNGLFRTVVNVGGRNVTVTGNVINGTARIGTFFVP